MKRKGLSMDSFAKYAFLFVTVGVMLAMALQVNEQIQDELPITSVVDESVTYVNETAVFPECTPFIYVTTIGNTSRTLSSGNYTQAKDVGITLTYISDDLDDNLVWNTTYTCGNTTEYLAVENSTAGIATLTEWMPIIAVVVAAALIIGLLVMAFSPAVRF